MTAPPAVALEACLALLEKAVEGELKCHDGPDGYQHRIGAGILGVCDVFASSDAAAIVAAVNLLKDHGPALLAALRLREWRPIAEAPERTRVLVCGGDVETVTIAESDPGRYQQTPVTDRQEWYRVGTRGSGRIWPHPTHWMPLPSPPTADDLARVLEEGE